MKMKIFAPLSALVLIACSDGASDKMGTPVSGLVMTYSSAPHDGEGCRPQREDVANIGESGLIAFRGESVFETPSGVTEIPFQSVHNYPDEDGMSEDTSITLLNQVAACEEVAITVTVEHCEYQGETGREERACPEISVAPGHPFASIEVVRADM